MLEPKTFSGGLHPPGLKTASDKKIERLPVPDRVVLHVSQHIGAPAKPTFKITDQVKYGQCIAEPGGFVSAPIHATVSGKIIGVGNFMHPFGIPSPAIAIERNPDEPERSYECENGFNLPIEQIKKRIQDSGVVGLGGATFPTHVKLSPPDSKPIDTVILNGVECEPALTSDHRLMIEQPERVINGLKLIMKVLNAKRGIIGIELNKLDAIKLLNEHVANEENIVIQPLEVKYPQGSEKQLIYACINKEVPSGKLPMDIGVVVQNVASAAAISDAVNCNKPLVEKVVTLSGNCVKNPGNYLVRLGTTVVQFIEMAGGLKEDVELKKVIMGGPMMGLALFDLHVPIIKGTSGILCWDADEAKSAKETSCLRCGSCIKACPMRLMPQHLRLLVEKQNWEAADRFGLLDCVECGCCAYTCPAGLPLVQTFKMGKKVVLNLRKMLADKKEVT